MPAFQPVAGTRAQVDARPVVNGQFLVATDTGEIFVDIGGVRVPVASGDGGSDDGDEPSATTFSIVSAALAMSDSVSGGGPGSGLYEAPAASLESPGDGFVTDYSITEEDNDQ